MRKNIIDNKIEDALKIKASKIEINKNNIEIAKRNIFHNIEEAESMKKIGFKKTALIVAALCVLGSITAVAASSFTMTVAHSFLNEEVKSFEQVAEIAEKADMNLKYPEKFSNGYEFKSAIPVYGNYEDEETNTSSPQWTDISITYENKDGKDVMMSVSSVLPPMEENNSSENYNGIEIGYYSYNALFVPPTYELTEEEKALEASGDIVVSYGTDEVKKEFIEYVSWSDDGLTYSLMTQNGSLGNDGLTEMAKEIIDK
jgi:hypothetical protein